MRWVALMRWRWADILVTISIAACATGALWLLAKGSPYSRRSLRSDIDDLERRVRALEQR